MDEKRAFKSDVSKTLKPLRCISKCLAILPICSESKNVYTAFIIVAYVCSYLYTTYGKCFHMPNSLVSTVFFLDTATDFTLAGSLIFTIVLVNIKRADKERNLLEKLSDLDGEFYKLGREVKWNKRRFYVELVVTHVVFCVYYAYYCWIWLSSLGMSIFKYFFVRDIQSYHLLILSLLIRNYALAMKARCDALHAILGDLSVLNGTTVSTVNYISKHTNAERVKRIYTKLCGICADFNAIFGECFVILYINIVMNLLGPANLAFVYGTGKYDIAGQKFGFSLIVLCVVWCFLPVINSWAIFSGCDQCTSEMGRTSNVCYYAIQHLSNDGKEGALREDLKELAQEASNTRPQIVAAGFFIVNYTVLFHLVGSITSYLIVLLQFLK